MPGLFWIVAWLLLVALAIGAFFGAPYLPILSSEQRRLLRDLDLKPGQSIIDLGSGDGRLLLAAAKLGIRATGYEISPILWLISVLRTWPYRKLVRVKLGNFWNLDWPPADVVYLFLITRYMSKIEGQLAKRLTSPTVVVSYAFALPSRKLWKKKGAAFLYRYP